MMELPHEDTADNGAQLVHYSTVYLGKHGATAPWQALAIAHTIYQDMEHI